MPEEQSGTLAADVCKEGAVVIISLKGDLDLYQDELQELLQATVDDQSCQAIILDLHAATYLASFAVAVIGHHFRRLNDRSGYLALVLPGATTAKPFRLAGLMDVIPTFTTLEDARSALKAQGINQA